jgi:hypothetical protein
MPRHTAARTESTRNAGDGAAGSVHPRHEAGGREADAWRDRTGPVERLLDRWKDAVRRADLVRFGSLLIALDLVAALSACFAPRLTSTLAIGRLVALVIFVPAVLRTLAMRHADRPDAELLKAIAVAIGVAGVYFVLRTYLVVEICAL